MPSDCLYNIHVVIRRSVRVEGNRPGSAAVACLPIHGDFEPSICWHLVSSEQTGTFLPPQTRWILNLLPAASATLLEFCYECAVPTACFEHPTTAGAHAFLQTQSVSSDPRYQQRPATTNGLPSGALSGLLGTRSEETE
jgi:hypothetical protein